MCAGEQAISGRQSMAIVWVGVWCHGLCAGGMHSGARKQAEPCCRDLMPPAVKEGGHKSELTCLSGHHRAAAMHPLPTAGDLGFKMAEQRYLWSVLPCLMAWPTIAMPVGHAAGMQVRQAWWVSAVG